MTVAHVLNIILFLYSSMISNGLYQRKDEGGITSGTHISSHSQISDYNALEGRDYEEIDVTDDKHDYHHLQRPSPPLHPTSSVGTRSNGAFQFSAPKEFHSMSTLTSQMGGVSAREREVFQQHQQQQLQFQGRSHTFGTLPLLKNDGPDNHIYRELEETPTVGGGPLNSSNSQGAIGVKDIYRSPTDSESPDSAGLFGGSGRVAATMPGVMSASSCGNGGDTVVFGYPPMANESLYSPTFEVGGQAVRVQQGGLGNVPETGTMFVEPSNPTAFPVHNYERIADASAGQQYEKPIVTKKKNSSTSSCSSMPPPPPPSSSSSTTPFSTAQSAPSMGPAPVSRSRSNSGARYETELPQALHEDDTNSAQYSKLVRPSEPPPTIPEVPPPHEIGAFPPPPEAQYYSELGSSLPDEEPIRPQIDRGAFSQSTAELSSSYRGERGVAMTGKSRHGGPKLERGFTIPAHISSTGYNVIQRATSTSSTPASDYPSPSPSFSSGTPRLHHQSSDERRNPPPPVFQMDGFGFNDSRSQPEVAEMQYPPPHPTSTPTSTSASAGSGPGYRRNGSFDAVGARRVYGHKRAWSEERRGGDVSYPESNGGVGMNRSGISGSAIDGRALGTQAAHHQHSSTSKMRDLRVNGYDPRMGDYARTKTMV